MKVRALFIIAVIGCVISALAAIIALSAVLFTRSDRHGKRAAKAISDAITKSLAPLEQRVSLLEQGTGPEARERDRLLIKGAIAEGLRPTENTVAAMAAKVDALWSQLSVSMANILHQPDPARRHVDELLEAFVHNTLTPAERTELRKYLVTIKNWEPGKETPFPIHPGEQVAAAILLLTMDDPPPGRGNHA